MESVSKPMAQAPQRQAAPERLGKYALLGLVGKGAMGVVYKSFDPHIKRPVALKTIRRDLIDEDDAGNFASRFRNEAQAAGGLAHPGIVAVYEYGEEGEFAYIAMEFVEGSSLRQYHDQKVRFGVSDTISILAQLLDALQYAHERGVWHRDIKPGNIMIMSNGRIKITDFGIARIESSTLTQVGAILGTPGFIAPELYLGTECDCRVDVFAAGVVAYQLLVGSTPFTGPPENVMYKVCYETPVAPSVAAREPALQRYDAPVMRALAKRPQDRYASAAEFRDALLQAHAATVSPAVSEETIIVNPQQVQPLRAGHESSRPSPAPSRGPGASAPVAASSPSGGSGGAAVSTASLEAAGWDMELLARIERHLARFIGPVARVMVKRAAAASSDAPGVLHWLAENIISPTDRAEFLRFGAAAGDEATVRPGPLTVQGPNSRLGTPSRFGPTTLQVPLTPSASDLAMAGKLLAPHLGPIAPVVVKRAAAQPGVSRDEFFYALAKHLTSDKDRAAFLAQFGLLA
jgi:serine/threonine-protein kinase